MDFFINFFLVKLVVLYNTKVARILDGFYTVDFSLFTSQNLNGSDSTVQPLPPPLQNSKLHMYIKGNGPNSKYLHI